MATGAVLLVLLVAPMGSARSADNAPDSSPSGPALSYLAPGYSAAPLAVGMPAGVGVGGLAVRADGALVIWPVRSSGAAFDDYMHLLPPGGGTVSAANRFGPSLAPASVGAGADYRSLAIADGRLWALGTFASGAPRNGQVQLWELDPQSGKLVATYWIAAPFGDNGNVGGQEIASDPAGGGVLVADYNPPIPQASKPPPPDSSTAASEHYELLDFSADGNRHAVYTYQGGTSCGTGQNGGYPSVGVPAGSSCDRWLYPRALGVNPAGNVIFMSEEGEGADPDINDIEGFVRTGTVQYIVSVPWQDQDPPSDTPVALASGSSGCLSDELFYGVDDGTAAPAASGDFFVVQHLSYGSIALVGSELAAPAAMAGAPAHFATFLANSPSGALVAAAWSTVVSIGCARPAAPVQRTHTVVAAAPPAPKPPPSGSSPVNLVSRAAPLGLPGPPAGGAPAAAIQSSAQGAAQASASPNLVGAADATEDQPAMAMPAAALEPRPVTEWWLATVVLTGAASVVAGLGVMERRRRRLTALAHTTIRPVVPTHGSGPPWR
ncbi:MAG TPA: hypothetical protein VE990_00305 [Acidimicrobiales bacterium]|nr:hypothetical protein [Acidimicrobiales bacterium]